MPHRTSGALATKAGAARKLGFSVYHVTRAVRDGELVEVHCGTKRWISDQSIERLIKKLGLTPFPGGDGEPGEPQ